MSSSVSTLEDFDAHRNALIDQKFQELNRALYSEDILGKVIRTHLVIQREMYDIIARTLPRGATYKVPGFENAIRLIYALGKCDDDIQQATLALSEIRNRFAHGNEPAITPKLLEKIKSGLESAEMFEPHYYEHFIKPNHVDSQMGAFLVKLFIFWARLASSIPYPEDSVEKPGVEPGSYSEPNG